MLASYAAVNEALVAGLGMLGIRVSVRDSAPVWPETGVDFGCFESPGRHEVYWAGRKLVASAQRRTNRRRPPTGDDSARRDGGRVWRICSVLDPGRRERFRRDLNDRTGTLSRALDIEPNFREVAHALSQGFQSGFAVSSWILD